MTHLPSNCSPVSHPNALEPSVLPFPSCHTPAVPCAWSSPPPFITLRIVCFMPPFHVLCLSSRPSPECQDPFIKPHFWGDGVRGTKPPRQIHTPPPEEGRPFFRGANRKLQGALTMPSSVSRRTSYFQWIRGSFAKGEALRR